MVPHAVGAFCLSEALNRPGIVAKGVVAHTEVRSQILEGKIPYGRSLGKGALAGIRVPVIIARH